MALRATIIALLAQGGLAALCSPGSYGTPPNCTPCDVSIPPGYYCAAGSAAQSARSEPRSLSLLRSASRSDGTPYLASMGLRLPPGEAWEWTQQRDRGVWGNEVRRAMHLPLGRHCPPSCWVGPHLCGAPPDTFFIPGVACEPEGRSAIPGAASVERLLGRMLQ